MELSYTLEVANEFANIFWPEKNKIKLKDILLYGSTARNNSNPRDLDLILLHQNPEFDDFEKTSRRKDISDIEKIFYLNKIVSQHFNLQEKLQNTKTLNLISQNLFNTKFLNLEYFTNNQYKQNWNNQNVWDKENFLKDLETQGKLWNPKEQKYNIPANQKYIFTL